MVRGARAATVVVNFDQPDDAVAAVEAVQNGSFLSNTIVLVDNNPDATPGSDLAARLDPTVTYLPMGFNSGYAAANNAGIKWAKALHDVDYAWVLNPDTVPEPDALGELVAAADAFPDAALIGSRLVNREGRTLYNGAVVDRVTGETRHLGSGLPAAQLPEREPFDTDYANGASVLVRASLVPIIGLIPEDYFLYFEETDYALRCRLLGFRVLVAPHSVVVHDRRSWGQLPTSAYIYYMVRNREIFSRRWGFDVDNAHRSATDAFVSGWRAKIAKNRPDIVERFDELVSSALADGMAGRTGPSPFPGEVKLG